MIKKEMLAYMAGLIDGEGYIGIKKDLIKGRAKNPAYYERMSIANLNKPMIDMFFNLFSCGNIQLHKPSKISKRGYWSWEITNRKATVVIQQLYPYLMVKKPEADLVLKLSKNKEKKYFLLPEEIVKYRESLYQDIKTLHTFIP